MDQFLLKISSYTKYWVFIVLTLSFASCSFPVSDYKISLGDEYFYISEGAQHQLITGPGNASFDGLVSCDVVAYDFDKLHIVAKQKINKECCCDAYNGLTKYWIIDKAIQKVIGPLDSLEFENKRKEIGVSNKLRLRI